MYIFSPGHHQTNLFPVSEKPSSLSHKVSSSLVTGIIMCTSSRSSNKKNPELSTATGHSHVRKTSILKKNNKIGGSSYSDLKKVWFDSVEVKYHKIILGDNPSVTDGAPITIHWKSHDRKLMDIDDFEEEKESSSKRGSRGSGSSSSSNNNCNKKFNGSGGRSYTSRDLRLNVQDRAAILLGEGYSLNQIAKKTEEVHAIQREREKSASKVKWDGVNEALESSGRVFRRLARLNIGGGEGSSTSTTVHKTMQTNPAA